MQRSSSSSRPQPIGLVTWPSSQPQENCLLADPFGAAARLSASPLLRAEADRNRGTEVFDALVVLAAGSWHADAIASGFARVVELNRAMEEGRVQRLVKLGFSPDVALELSGLHTRNFM